MTAVDVRRGVRIPTAADPSVTLAADLYVPAGGGPAPALVTVLPYRKDGPLGIVLAESALRWFAERGYASLLVDLRGVGSSDGTQRPPFDPAEADDAVDAIAWAAAQPWCDGNVGMWGHSYGGLLTLRAASHRPPALKAIMPVEPMTDPDRDFVRPEGAAGYMEPLQWGALTLLCQLLPPLRDFGSADEQRRWQQRRDETQPYVVDLYGRVGSPVDASLITAPALCVGGWRDLFCDATVRAFETASGPKALVMGPWTHTMPNVSPVAPVDLLGIALRWWDRWLRNVDNGVDREPPVRAYVQGDRPGWQAFTSWPPAGTTAGGLTVGAGAYEPDPTIGLLSGLWGSVAALPVPLDQQDDDARAFCVDSAALAAPITIAGRPRVSIDGGPELVARLTDVDADGRSTLITAGAGGELWPTAYRVAAGHRLRVAVSDSDFPRRRPRVTGEPVMVSVTDACIPLVSEGVDVELPPAPALGDEILALGVWSAPRFAMKRGVVEFGSTSTTYSPDRVYEIQMEQNTRATVDAVVVDISASALVDTGQRVDVRVAARHDSTGVRVEASIDSDYARTWDVDP